MPWCMWWEEYGDFPNKLREREPANVLITDLCEAVMAYVCLISDTSKAILTDTGIARQTIEAINEMSLRRFAKGFYKD